MEKKYFVFEVETYYKNGKTDTEHISATSEEEMWGIYDSEHMDEIDLIDDSAIVDSWILFTHQQCSIG